MIAVSSFRPFADASSEYGRNQIRAFESWKKAFHTIVYFNDPQPELDSDKTVFIPSEPFPKIYELARFCSGQSDWCAIINADIVVGPRFPVLERKLKNSPRAMSASSWRYEFDPAEGIETGKVVDCGLDFFCATPGVWDQASNLLHPGLRLGCQSWDTQMLSFLSTFTVAGFYDLTPGRVIFHPRHGGRLYGPCVDPRDIRIWGTPIMPHSKIQ